MSNPALAPDQMWQNGAAAVSEVALSQGSPIAGETAQRSSVSTAVIAGIGLALVAIRVLHLVGAPVTTDDVWWHLRLGEEYTAHGPWLESDPLLYTAVEGAPPPHAWLFGVAVSAVDRLLGLHGLRVVHVAIAVFIIGLAYCIFRRESGLRAPAFLATTASLACVPTSSASPRRFCSSFCCCKGTSLPPGVAWRRASCWFSSGRTSTRPLPSLLSS
jgi:hypothetical protein